MEGRDPTPRSIRRAALLATLLLATRTALCAPGSELRFDIPATDFSAAIVEFARQAKVEILYATPVSVQGIRTQAVIGDLELAEALRKLLTGSGFTFEFENARSVLVKPQESPAAAQQEAVKATLSSLGEKVVQPLAQDVVVTGSYLHGVLDIMSPLEFVTRKEMQQTPYATVQDALQSLPNNFLSAQSENFGGVGNFNRGSAPNLRGLGYGATLVLVNGRRQPSAGTSADFVDVSNIPWSAVDHIEVLPDGVSALYGSDAIAGVVNIILRDRLDGAETQIHTGTAPDGASETMIGQLLGRTSEHGHWLLSYQFSDRSTLAAADRGYAADADKTAFGGRNFRSFLSNPGNILDPATFEPVSAIPQGQDGRSLTAADLLEGVINRENQFQSYDLVPQRQMHNLYATGSLKLSDSLELFGEGRYTRRDIQYKTFPAETVLSVPSKHPFFKPGDGPDQVLVGYSFLDDLGPQANAGRTRGYSSTLGLRATSQSEWHSAVSASYGKEELTSTGYNRVNFEALNNALNDPDPATVFNPFGDGSFNNPDTLAGIRRTEIQGAASATAAAQLIVDGPGFCLPAGEGKLALGAEYRSESLLADFTSPGQFDRRIGSAFAELSLPLIGNALDARAAPRLELSLAGRYERYSDFGESFNPKVGLRWVPWSWLKLRSSWGTSFKAPKLIDLYNTADNISGITVFPDPRSPSGRSLVGVLQGTNPDLREETASSWTLGLDLSSTRAPAWSASLTYFDIDYRNQVVQPGPAFPLDILFQEEQWQAVIQRQPSPQQIVDLCNRPDLYTPKPQCLDSSLAAIVDIRLRNLSSTRTRGLDLRLERERNTSFGALRFALAGSYIADFSEALTSSSRPIDVVGRVSKPAALRARGTAQWSAHGPDQPGLGGQVVASYVGRYRDVESPFLSDVRPWWTIDAQLNYRTRLGNGWLENAELTFNVANLLNTDPPFVDRNFGFDIANALPYGRVVNLYVKKSW